jgi:hypothetical protein
MNKNKVLISAVIAILLVSSLAVAVDFAAASPFGNSAANVANRLVSASWIRINGVIDKWGTTDVRGQLQTYARTAVRESTDNNQITSATAIWTTNITRAISAARAKENFTYLYYVARLPNASISSVNADSASSYFLSGTWNLATITSTITVLTNENGTIIKVHRDQDIVPSQAYGELTITGNQFTLSITGIDPLTGSVWRSITRSWFNPFKMTDDSTTAIVTKSDVNAVAQCYGAMPGWGNYDTSMDFNNNYRVDIADISTVAANM